MKKSEFLKIKEKYLKASKRFQGIKKGDLVWESVPGGIDLDYHPAVVKEVNVDKNYVDVIDVSNQNQEKRYESFLTESELIGLKGISKKIIEEEYKKYEGIIKTILHQNRK